MQQQQQHSIYKMSHVPPLYRWPYWIDVRIILGNATYDFLANIPTLICFQNTSHHYQWETICSIWKTQQCHPIQSNCILSKQSGTTLEYLHPINPVSARQLSHLKTTQKPHQTGFWWQPHHQIQHNLQLTEQGLQYEPMKDLHKSTFKQRQRRY